jgi:hypothetical protein
MIWVAWRQHRTECLLMATALAVLAVFLLLTGLPLAGLSQQTGVTTCVAQNGNCGSLALSFATQAQAFNEIAGFFPLLPLLPGLLIGAPLVARELERHTYILVWTQSIARLRWLSVKAALVLFTGGLSSAVILPLLIWWYGPFAQVNGRFVLTIFDFEGPVLVGATLLALTLGILAGALVRRTVPAMFLTPALFLAIRLPVELFLRPHYEPPVVVVTPLGQPSSYQVSTQDWLINDSALDAQEHLLSISTCAGYQTLQACQQATGIRSYYWAYQPADRFWTFQWIETSIYLGFALLALGAAFWLVRRRLS